MNAVGETLNKTANKAINNKTGNRDSNKASNRLQVGRANKVNRDADNRTEWSAGQQDNKVRTARSGQQGQQSGQQSGQQGGQQQAGGSQTWPALVIDADGAPQGPMEWRGDTATTFRGT
jgi:hypothetical protein